MKMSCIFFLNICMLDICLTLSGKLFHSTAPDLKKALSPNVLHLVFGALHAWIKSSACRVTSLTPSSAKDRGLVRLMIASDTMFFARLPLFRFQ